MRIVCDRCKEKVVRFEDREDWKHIEVSNVRCGILGDYYLCEQCSDAFYKFLSNKAGEQE